MNGHIDQNCFALKRGDVVPEGMRCVGCMPAGPGAAKCILEWQARQSRGFDRGELALLDDVADRDETPIHRHVWVSYRESFGMADMGLSYRCLGCPKDLTPSRAP